MLKVCIEIISTGEHSWIPIPNGDLVTAISDFTEGKDYEVVIITGMKKDGITLFPNNNFHKCDILEFNNMLLQAHDFQYTDKNLAVLNLLLEYRNYNCDEVISLYENDCFKVYEAVDMETVAMEYLENTTEWYSEFEEKNLLSYFDFKSYGEEVLRHNGIWLQDRKIIVEVFE